MARKPGASTKVTKLRRQAEARLLTTTRDIAAMSRKDVQHLVHELQVHQIELEMQNDELRRAQAELAAMRDRYRDSYVDLYEFAPVGHLTLDSQSRIVEANLRASTLLGMNRNELVGRPLAQFVAPDDADTFHRHCQHVLQTGMRQTCEVRLRGGVVTPRWIYFESLVLRDEPARTTRWRTALLDTTERKRAEQELEERAGLTAFVEKFSLSLNRDESLDRLLQSCAETVITGLGSVFARIWVMDAGDLCGEYHKAEWCKDHTRCLHLQASAGLSLNLNGEYRRVPLGALKVGQIAQSAAGMITNDVLHDERLPNKQWMRENRLQSFAGYPLVVDGRVFGVLAVFGRKALSTVTLKTLESMCHGLATAIARKQAEEALHFNQRELRRHQEQLQDLTSKLITAQEKERQRISRDLHDDFSQRLAALVLDLAALEQQPPLRPEVVANALAPIRHQLEQLADDVHNLAYRLHPSLLEHAGLQPAIEDHIHQVTQRTGLRITLKVGRMPGWLSLDQATCLFRVLQECLQNIVKHANATEAMVKLSGSSTGVGLSVIDNGSGFDASDKSIHQQKGLGLISMQERLRLLNGFLRIHSRPADGTKVCAWIPAKEGPP